MKKYLRILLPLMILVVFAAIGTSKTNAATANIPIKTLSDSTITTADISYSDQLTTWGSNGNETTYFVYPVTATATGKMYINVKTPSSNQYAISSAIGKFDGTNFTTKGTTGYTSPGNVDTGIGCYDVVKGKTYYVGLQRISSSYYDTAQVKAYIVPYANNRVLKAQSKWLIASAIKGTSSSNYSNSTIYYKVTPTKTGVMTVSLKQFGYDGSAGYVTLYSSGKKLRSEKLYYSSSSSAYKVRFGVKKGVTYYLKVTGVSGTSKYNYKYGIKYSVAAATDRSLSKKSSAKTLVRKATSTPTLFTANGVTETDWYKFKVTSKRKTVISVDASEMRGSDQKLTITTYKGSTKIDTCTLCPGQSGKITITYGTTYGKANAGTYYVKVTKTSKLSGKYRIKYVI